MGIDAVGPGAVFLDRDGVLNALVLNPSTGRMESPLTPDDFRLQNGVLPALQRMQAAGYPLVLVSNQPNYALGKSSMETLEAIHFCLMLELTAASIHLTACYYCFHHPKGVVPDYSCSCVCRKPSPWFLRRARDEFGYSLPNSWMIGDQPTDVACGRAAGARTIRIQAESGSALPNGTPSCLSISDGGADYCARDLSEAAGIILSQPHR